MHCVSKFFENTQPRPVAASVGYRESTGRDDDRICLNRRTILQLDCPPAAVVREVSHGRLVPNADALLNGVRQQSVANITRLVRSGKPLAELSLFDERNSEIVLEKRNLFVQR